MWKNLVEPNSRIRRMRRGACWITRATETHSEYVILVAFPRQQWLCQCACVAWIVRCLSWTVFWKIQASCTCTKSGSAILASKFNCFPLFTLSFSVGWIMEHAGHRLFTHCGVFPTSMNILFHIISPCWGYDCILWQCFCVFFMYASVTMPVFFWAWHIGAVIC
jgi:hypothetical protein